MDIYEQFYKEYYNQDTLRHEHGFITYEIIREHETIHIGNVFVIPDKRDLGLGTRLLTDALALGKEQGCKQAIGFVRRDNPNLETALVTWLHYGCSVMDMNADKITLRKDL